MEKVMCTLAPSGLKSLRQHKNTIISWTIGMIFIGGSVRHTLFKETLF